MFTLLAIGTVAGIVFGLRCNVFVLVPITLLAVAGITLRNIATHQDVESIVIAVFASVALLQIGYIVGCVLRIAAQAHPPTRVNLPHRASKSEVTYWTTQ